MMILQYQNISKNGKTIFMQRKLFKPSSYLDAFHFSKEISIESHNYVPSCKKNEIHLYIIYDVFHIYIINSNNVKSQKY